MRSKLISKLTKLKTLRDHPNTISAEKKAAQLAINRINEKLKETPHISRTLCYYCAMEEGLKEDEIMVFSSDGSCEECGTIHLDVSSDWKE